MFSIEVKIKLCLKHLWFLLIYWIINTSIKSHDDCESKMDSRCLQSLSCSFPKVFLHEIFALYELRTFQVYVWKKQHMKSNLV